MKWSDVREFLGVCAEGLGAILDLFLSFIAFIGEIFGN